MGLAVFFSLTIIMVILIVVIIILVTSYKNKKYRFLLEKQQMENNYQNQLLLSRLEVQEQTFNLFSEEIHDNIGQLLSFIKMKLYYIKSNSPDENAVKDASDCLDLLGKAITDLRNLSHVLNGNYSTSVGLVRAIKKDIDYLNSSRNVQCLLKIVGQEYSLGSERELLVFRIVQEALNNSIKHSHASLVEVVLSYYAENFEIQIKDNGAGFDSGSQQVGIGLKNMQVRADMLHSSLQIVSTPKEGTSVILKMTK